MSEFVLVYRGGNMGATEEERSRVMAQWMQWFQSVGDRMVNTGNPFENSRAVRADGTVEEVAPSGLSGYSVVRADSFDQVVGWARECPVRLGGGSVEVYETTPVPVR